MLLLSVTLVTTSVEIWGIDFLPTTSELMHFFFSDFSYLVENETEEGGQRHFNTVLSLFSVFLSLSPIYLLQFIKKK